MAEPNWSAMDAMAAHAVINQPSPTARAAGAINREDAASMRQATNLPSRPSAVDIFGERQSPAVHVREHALQRDYPRGYVLYVDNERRGVIDGYEGTTFLVIVGDDGIGHPVSVRDIRGAPRHQVVPPEFDELIRQKTEEAAAQPATEEPAPEELSGPGPRRHRRVRIRHETP